MRYVLPVFLLVLSSSCFAGMWSKNQVLGKYVCTDDRSLCVKLTVDLDIKHFYLELHGRVNKVSRSGTATLELQGYNRSGPVTTEYLDININGEYSQIVESRSRRIRGIDRDVRFKVTKLYF